MAKPVSPRMITPELGATSPNHSPWVYNEPMEFIYLIPLAFIGAIMGLPVLTLALVVLVISSMFLKMPRRGTSYCAFFLGGLAVAKLQWMIFTHGGGEEVAFQILASILYVTVSSITGFVASLEFLRRDKYMQVMVFMTVLLGALQAASTLNLLSYHVLNMYACSYALVCISIPAILAFSPKVLR